jgi:8-oxo-dGTP pyrophosphatase MutT (NUDIX family)
VHADERFRNLAGLLGQLEQAYLDGDFPMAGVQVPDLIPHSFRVSSLSVKGVAVQDGRVLLLENKRAEWELPGGKLELGEDPLPCVVREISEESGWQVTAGPVLDCWQYHISGGQDVVIVTYGCYVASTTPPMISNEHKQAGLFTHGEVPDLNMPDGYKRSIMTWFAHLTANTGQTRP